MSDERAREPQTKAAQRLLGELLGRYGQSVLDPMSDQLTREALVAIELEAELTLARAIAGPALDVDSRVALESAEYALSLIVNATVDDRTWFEEACQARTTVMARLAAARFPAAEAHTFVAGRPFAADGSCFTCGQPFTAHARLGGPHRRG